MILSDKGILRAVADGNIKITNFDKSKLNPNSYNLTLFNQLKIYENSHLDMKRNEIANTVLIPQTGYWLQPNTLYLGRTNERTFTQNLVPMLEGRSSIGRYGIFIHVTAGFGDNGFNGFWTLEIVCVQPVKIYPNIEIAQIYYHTLDDTTGKKYEGKYQDNNDIQTSRIWEEFK